MGLENTKAYISHQNIIWKYYYKLLTQREQAYFSLSSKKVSYEKVVSKVSKMIKLGSKIKENVMGQYGTDYINDKGEILSFKQV